ncbi:MAG: mobile mystery protein A [Pseudobdellovibrionaceae bacterium]
MDQRKRLDQLIAHFDLSPLREKPRKGWLKAVRESLGISAQQLAKRMKLKNHASILAFEKREKEKAITLKAMEDMAGAMDCHFIYAVVPSGSSFEKLIDERAKKIAEQMIQKVAHSMKLENQSITQDQQAQQIIELAKELKEKLDHRLWD